MSRFADSPIAGATFAPWDFESPHGEKKGGFVVHNPAATYRLRLWRSVAPTPKRRVAFVMLNPSTAGERVDDPTIRRCIGFARTWGFDALDVVNLFAFRATAPDVLVAAWEGGKDIVGPRNDETIREVVAGAELIVAAWGGPHKILSRKRLVARETEVLELLSAGRDVHAIRVFGKGLQPRHPLYLRGDAAPALLLPREWSADR